MLPRSLGDADILERLRTRFDVTAEAIERLALGHDADASVYRVHTRDRRLFLKARRGPVHEAGLAIPRLLTGRGIQHLISPIPTVAGALFDAGPVALVLFPWVDGDSGARVGLSNAQWEELGATLRAIHDQPVDAFASMLRAEDFVPARTGAIRRLQDRLAVTAAGDDPAGRVVSCWRSNQDRIDRLVEITETLAPVARDRARPMVLCHADAHAGNVMVTTDDDVVLVDWDSAMIAPRERDLMFVDGLAGGHEADPTSFFAGYGKIEVDAEVLAYYRVEWTVQDIAEFATHVLVDPTADDDARAESAKIFASLFAPGGPAEAYASS